MTQYFLTMPHDSQSEPTMASMQEMDAALMQAQLQAQAAAAGPQRRLGGAAEGMASSNTESTSGNEPRGNSMGPV